MGRSCMGIIQSNRKHGLVATGLWNYQKSIEADIVNAYDTETGLVKVNPLFLIGEQTYPRWMQPADIYESECLGTKCCSLSKLI